MQANMVWRHNGPPADNAAAALSLGERVLLSVALEALCLAAHAEQLVVRAHAWRAARQTEFGARP
jgi:hypothetical protein